MRTIITFIWLSAVTICAVAHGTVIRGVVVDTIGTKLKSVELQIDGLNVDTFTDAKGDFRFQDIPPGCYAVRALPELKAAQTKIVLAVGNEVIIHFEFPYHDRSQDGEPSLIPDRVGKIIGRVLSYKAPHDPLCRTFVVLFVPDFGDAQVGAHGEYEQKLPFGTYTVSVKDEDAAPVIVTLNKNVIRAKDLLVRDNKP